MSDVFDLRHVFVRRGGREILADITWTVRDGERWAMLGPNGAGKTTLLRLLSTHLMASAGEVSVLDHRIGRVDVRGLRARLGYVSPSLDRLIEPELTAGQLVDAAQAGATVPWYVPPDQIDDRRTVDALAVAGALEHRDRRYGLLSSGEQLRVLLARALVAEPEALVLDEPMSHLDLAARERLISSLARLDTLPALRSVVLVVHRAEDIPPNFTHALLLREGRVLAAGRLEEALTEAALAECFEVPLRLTRLEGRYVALAPAFPAAGPVR